MNRTASCPGCGASISFRWSSAIQTTCPFCRSILVRTDVDLRKVGEVGDLPASVSPIQIGTMGIDDGVSFTVVGRILYEYERGGWNEWYLRRDDGGSAWLSDAQAEYAVTTLATGAGALPAASAVHVSQTYSWCGRMYKVVSLTRARYRGVEGELPFETWNRREALFADLEGDGERFATLDYSDGTPALYLGRWCDLDELSLTNLRRIEGW